MPGTSLSLSSDRRREAIRCLYCLVAGVLITAALMIFGFMGSMLHSAPDLDITRRGVTVVPSDMPEEIPVQQQVKPTAEPIVPKMQITPDVPEPIEPVPVTVKYAINPRITVGVRVPAPPAFSAPSVTPEFLGPGELDVQPHLIHAPRPAYPSQARQLRREGRVIARIVIDMEGRVLRCRVIPGPDADVFGQTTLDAVRRWRFKPGVRGGRAVACEVEVPVVFTLKD